jgi:endonuclease-8
VDKAVLNVMGSLIHPSSGPKQMALYMMDPGFDPAKAITVARTLLLRNADRPEQSTTGELGRGRQHWVYLRDGRPCRRCGTRVGMYELGDGLYARSAYHCPGCQPEPR